jgi:hypothetical protein
MVTASTLIDVLSLLAVKPDEEYLSAFENTRPVA